MIDFNELFRNFLTREVYPRTEGKYYPSEIGNCLRKGYYSYKMPKQFDPEILKLFEAGNIIHDLITKVIKSDKNPEIDLLATETPVFLTHGDFIISGRMDDVLLVRIDGKIYILEVKSVAKLAFNEPKQAHIAQLMLYMHSTGIHDGILLYIDRSYLKTMSFDVKYNPDTIKETLERFSLLHNHIKTNSIPEPEARIKKTELGWQCPSCQYKDECYKETPDDLIKNDTK